MIPQSTPGTGLQTRDRRRAAAWAQSRGSRAGARARRRRPALPSQPRHAPCQWARRSDRSLVLGQRGAAGPWGVLGAVREGGSRDRPRGGERAAALHGRRDACHRGAAAEAPADLPVCVNERVGAPVSAACASEREATGRLPAKLQSPGTCTRAALARTAAANPPHPRSCGTCQTSSRHARRRFTQTAAAAAAGLRVCAWGTGGLP